MHALLLILSFGEVSFSKYSAILKLLFNLLGFDYIRIYSSDKALVLILKLNPLNVISY